jgi:hypothetical protein
MAVLEAAIGSMITLFQLSDQRCHTMMETFGALSGKDPFTGHFLLSRLWLSGRRDAGMIGPRTPILSCVASADATSLMLRRSFDSRLTTEIHSASEGDGEDSTSAKEG